MAAKVVFIASCNLSSFACLSQLLRHPAALFRGAMMWFTCFVLLINIGELVPNDKKLEKPNFSSSGFPAQQLGNSSSISINNKRKNFLDAEEEGSGLELMNKLSSNLHQDVSPTSIEATSSFTERVPSMRVHTKPNFPQVSQLSSDRWSNSGTALALSSGVDKDSSNSLFFPWLGQNAHLNGLLTLRESIPTASNNPLSRSESTLFDYNMKQLNLSNPITVDMLFRDIIGKCKKEQKYSIKSVNDLRRYSHELECIYGRGTAPTNIPIGLWYGDVLKVFGTEFLNFLVATLWSGKFVVLGSCSTNDKKIYNLAYNFVNNQLTLPAYVYIGYLRNETVAPGEHIDDAPHLFVDYTLDFNNVCSREDRKKVSNNPNFNLDLTNDPFPFNLIVDVVRTVGCTPDGGYIMLGKSLLRDSSKFPKNGDATIAYWSVINYDKAAHDKSSCSLRELNEDFTYRHEAPINHLFRVMIPQDQVLTNPIDSVLRYADFLLWRPLGYPALSNAVRLLDTQYPMAGVMAPQRNAAVQ